MAEQESKDAIGETKSVYMDLLTFLQSPRQDLRLAATDAVLVAASQENGPTTLVQMGFVKQLAKLSSHPGAVGSNALKSLLELSSSGPTASQCVLDMMECSTMGRMLEVSLSSPSLDEKEGPKVWRQRVNYAMSLLVNMTRTEEGAVDFIGRSVPDEAIPSSLANNTSESSSLDKIERESRPTLALLMARYLSNNYIVATEEETKKEDPGEHKGDKHDVNDPYQQFAAILMNLTQLESGRKYVMRVRKSPKDTTSSSPPSSVLQSLLGELRSKNAIRRRGTAGTIRNCCFDKDSSWWLLEEVRLTKELLYPLAGPEELDVDDRRGLDPDLWLEGPDKQREPDAMTRQLLVESILLLCASGRNSRKILRLQRTYVILKWADMVEEDETVSERVNECVQYLRRDEAGTSEGSSDQMVASQIMVAGKTQSLLALPAPTASQQVSSDETEADYDEID